MSDTDAELEIVKQAALEAGAFGFSFSSLSYLLSCAQGFEIISLFSFLFPFR